MKTFEFIFKGTIDARNIKSASRKADRISKKIKDQKDVHINEFSGTPAKNETKKQKKDKKDE